MIHGSYLIAAFNRTELYAFGLDINPAGGAYGIIGSATGAGLTIDLNHFYVTNSNDTIYDTSFTSSATIFGNTGVTTGYNFGSATALLLTTMPTYTNAGALGALHAVNGTATLSSGSATVTLTSPASFTSSSTYSCIATDQTAANAVKVANSSATQFVVTGTSSDVIAYQCMGT